MITSTVTTNAPSLGFRSSLDVCAFIDDLSTDQSGELVFLEAGDTPAGAVFVENGRVCWAAARGLARRLSDLLAASANLDANAMESLYDECKRQRRPLGEFLVETQRMTAGDLRAALLKHTTESLNALCTHDSNAAWIPRRSGGYSPRFTFSTVELLARTCAESHPSLAVSASAELADAFGESDWGAAFVRSETRAAPEPIALFGDVPAKVETLLRLGRWSSSSLDVTTSLDEDLGFVATILDGGALVAWRSSSTIVAGFTSPNGPARLLNRRARARRREAAHGDL